MPNCVDCRYWDRTDENRYNDPEDRRRCFRIEKEPKSIYGAICIYPEEGINFLVYTSPRFGCNIFSEKE